MLRKPLPNTVPLRQNSSLTSCKKRASYYEQLTQPCHCYLLATCSQKPSAAMFKLDIKVKLIATTPTQSVDLLVYWSQDPTQHGLDQKGQLLQHCKPIRKKRYPHSATLARHWCIQQATLSAQRKLGGAYYLAILTAPATPTVHHELSLTAELTWTENSAEKDPQIKFVHVKLWKSALTRWDNIEAYIPEAVKIVQNTYLLTALHRLEPLKDLRDRIIAWIMLSAIAHKETKTGCKSSHQIDLIKTGLQKTLQIAPTN